VDLRDELSVYRCVITVLEGVKEIDSPYHPGAEYATFETENASLDRGASWISLGYPLAGLVLFSLCFSLPSGFLFVRRALVYIQGFDNLQDNERIQ